MSKTTRQTTPTRRLPANLSSGLPYGLGALHLRGNSYWMIYRNAAGERVQENSGTGNLAAARIVLAERVLERIAAETVLVEGIIHESSVALARTGSSGAGTATAIKRGPRGNRRGARAATRTRQEAAR